MFKQLRFAFYTLSLTILSSATKSPQTNNPYEVLITNDLAHQRYNISIAVGTPPQPFNLLLDTGSADVWVPLSNSSGCAPSCPFGFDARTSSSIIPTNYTFDVCYGQECNVAIRGPYYNDTISVLGLPALPNATFAVADVPVAFVQTGNWGIFGVGSRINEGITQRYPNVSYTPLWQRITTTSPSGKSKFSLWLNQQSATQGTIQFGGADNSKYTGKLAKLPLNLDHGQVVAWSVNVTSVTRVTINEKGKEKKTLLTPGDYTNDFTFDSGSPNFYVPTGLYNAIATGLNATEIINGAPYVPCSLRYSASGSLEWGFPTAKRHTAKIRVPIAEIVYPYGYPVTVPLVPDRNGEKMCYFGLVPTESFVHLLGAPFLRSAYAVFDLDNEEVGIAQAVWGDV
jgi:hypothetical protein